MLLTSAEMSKISRLAFLNWIVELHIFSLLFGFSGLYPVFRIFPDPVEKPPFSFVLLIVNQTSRSPLSTIISRKICLLSWLIGTWNSTYYRRLIFLINFHNKFVVNKQPKNNVTDTACTLTVFQAFKDRFSAFSSLFVDV